MLDIRISDPEPTKDPFREAITVVVGPHKTRTIVVPTLQAQGARAFQVGMVVTELLQEAVAEGVRL